MYCKPKLPVFLFCALLGFLITPTWSQSEDTAVKEEVAVKNGFRILFDQRIGNCAACHSIPDAQGKKYGTQSNFAPPLDGVGSRYDRSVLMQWVTDARVIHPQTLMPPFGINLGNGRLLTDAQLTDVVATLHSLR